MARHSTSQTRAPRPPWVWAIHRTTVRVACCCFLEVVIMTTSTARLICCFCSRTSLYTTAACSTARTPRRPAAYCTISSWTSASSWATTSTAGVWRGKNNYNRSKRQQPRRTVYHSWSVLKRFWLLGYVDWPFKNKLPRQHLFFGVFFLTTEPQTGGYFNITPYSDWHYWHVFSVFFGSLRQSNWGQAPSIDRSQTE